VRRKPLVTLENQKNHKLKGGGDRSQNTQKAAQKEKQIGLSSDDNAFGRR
jgi:hypothetical protein